MKLRPTTFNLPHQKFSKTADEIVLESKPGKLVNEAPLLRGGVDPVSQAPANMEEADNLQKLFDELISSRH